MVELKEMVVRDDEKRLVEGFATVEVMDRQNDIIPVEAFVKAFIDFMDRGGIVLYGHENKPVGKVIQWEVAKKEDMNVEGVKVIVSLYRDNTLVDEVWKLVKQGGLLGFSIGGVAKEVEERVNKQDGSKVRVLKAIELNELSLVTIPANSGAVITATSIAKGMDDIMFKRPNREWWGKCITIAKEAGASKPEVVCGKLFYEVFEGNRNLADKELKKEIVEVEKSIVENEIQKPFAGFNNWEDCMKEMKGKYSEEVAEKVCGKLKAKYEKEAGGMDVNEEVEKVLGEFIKAKYPWDECIRDQTKRYGSKETAEKVCGAIRAKYGKGEVGSEVFNNENGIAKDKEVIDMAEEKVKVDEDEEDKDEKKEAVKDKDEEEKEEEEKKADVTSDNKMDILISQITRLLQVLEKLYSEESADVIVDETEKANYLTQGGHREDVGGQGVEGKKVRNRVMSQAMPEPKEEEDNVTAEELMRKDVKKVIKKSADVEGGMTDNFQFGRKDDEKMVDVSAILKGEAKAVDIAKKYWKGVR